MPKRLKTSGATAATCIGGSPSGATSNAEHSRIKRCRGQVLRRSLGGRRSPRRLERSGGNQLGQSLRAAASGPDDPYLFVMGRFDRADCSRRFAMLLSIRFSTGRTGLSLGARRGKFELAIELTEITWREQHRADEVESAVSGRGRHEISRGGISFSSLASCIHLLAGCRWDRGRRRGTGHRWRADGPLGLRA